MHIFIIKELNMNNFVLNIVNLMNYRGRILIAIMERGETVLSEERGNRERTEIYIYARKGGSLTVKAR